MNKGGEIVVEQNKWLGGDAFVCWRFQRTVVDLITPVGFLQKACFVPCLLSLLMAELPHQLMCTHKYVYKYKKQTFIHHINWCRISCINNVEMIIMMADENVHVQLTRFPSDRIGSWDVPPMDASCGCIMGQFGMWTIPMLGCLFAWFHHGCWSWVFQQTKLYDDVGCLIDCFIIANGFHDWKCLIDYPQHIKNSEVNCSIAPWTFHNKNKLKRLQASAERQESRTNTAKKHISEMCRRAAFKPLWHFIILIDWFIGILMLA